MERLSPLYEVKQLSFFRGEKVIIHNLNLTFPKNKIIALIGPSGGGKTTFLRLLAGLEQPTEGTVLLKGHAPKKSTIAFVPQDYGLLPWQKAQQAVLKAAQISRQEKLTSADLKNIEELFQQMKLTEVKHRYPNQLSGGQRQRVAITRGLASQSDVLLMDEPFSALDALTREKAQDLFLKVWEKNPRLTIFVTHDIEEALLLADEIIIMTSTGSIKKQVMSPFEKKLSLREKRQSESLFQEVAALRKEIEL